MRVYVSIGSNIEPEKNVRFAIAALRAAFGELTVSPVYRTAAVGFDGEDFLNLVVGFDSELPVEEIDDMLDQMEANAGRQRGAPKFAPRTLDIDLLLYGNEIVSGERLKLPRKEITEYLFVLQPLADIAAEQPHPVLGRTMRELLATLEFPGQRCEREEVSLESHSERGKA